MECDDQDGASADKASADDVSEHAEASHKATLNTPEDALNYWNWALETEQLSCHQFRQWWRKVVPTVLSPIPAMDYQSPEAHIDEDAVRSLIMAPLERFLLNGEPQEELARLSALNQPPAQCGKVFKFGNLSYSCKDCSLDATCVLCADCFKNSEHRFHRYKMSTSRGGGYCDCGDAEAFRSHVHCATHMVASGASDPLQHFPASIQTRAKHVFASVMKYIHEILTMEMVMSLPPDLTFKSNSDAMTGIREWLSSASTCAEDRYAVVVYNDEFHTFEEVISTLPRAVDCDRNAAVSFATLIDREGRALIKCAEFNFCSEAKSVIERITSRRNGKPLKVSIMHAHVVAHQSLALRLLAWMQDLLQLSVGFRVMFASVLQELDPKLLLDAMLTSNTRLWKSCRSRVRHLLVTGMLMENTSKRQFARAFTRCYGEMMKEFMQDDHEHGVSITSLSVQLFTVPSLAHYLIANECVLAVLFRTFMSECEQRKGVSGKLEFQRSMNASPSCKRSLFILNDVRYLLRTPPGKDIGIPLEWNDSLRKGFLHGVNMLLEILSWMQGMDPQVRQTAQHVEFELEWESAFTLQLRLAPIATLVLEWSNTDRIVFIKTVRMMLKTLREETSVEKDLPPVVSHTVCGHTVDCLDYAISKRAVSIHWPLTRLLAGLHLQMARFDLSLDSSELNVGERPGMTQLVEPALRTCVFVAQVQAGMWRRNGYSVQEQVKCYRDAKFRQEMLDRDIICVQMAAANMEPNQFVITLLNKFQLIPWSVADFDCAEDDSIRQTITIVEEFLHLLITVISERYVCGVGIVDSEQCLRKELIQLLCIDSMSHSELSRHITDEQTSSGVGFEAILKTVSEFKKPSSGTGKGLYEIKQEMLSEFNPFYFHYSKEDQSRAEQRKPPALAAKCFPPPKLPLFTKTFAAINNIMESDVFLYVLSLVLQRADNLKTRCFSEGQVYRALFLIGLCLNEEERARDALAQDGEAHPVAFTAKADKFAIFSLLQALVGSQRIHSHKELLAWVIAKWCHLKGESVTLPMADLDQSGSGEQENLDALAEKKRLADLRRAKIMAQMKSAQKNFIKENAQLFENTSSGLDQQQQQQDMDVELEVEVATTSNVCLGPLRSPPAAAPTTFTCILCQEEENLLPEGQALVTAAFIQKSTVLCRLPRGASLVDESADQQQTSSPQYVAFPLLTADLACAPFTSSCGHIMHGACWQKYFDDLVSSERQRNRQRYPHSFDTERQEFLCPLCRGLANCVIPIIPQFHIMQPQPADRSQLHIDFSDWLQALLIALKYKRELSESLPSEESGCPSGSDADSAKIRFYTCPLDQVVHDLEASQKMASSGKAFSRLFTDHEGCELQFSSSVFEMMNYFSQATFRVGLDALPSLHNERIPLMVWQTCAFTIEAVTCSFLEREPGRLLFSSISTMQHSCLSALMRVGAVVASNFGEPRIIRSHSLKLLSTLLEVDTRNLCVLEIDAFGLLVALTFALPSLFNNTQAAALPSANAQDLNILKIVFGMHLVQILLTTDRFSTEKPSDEPVSRAEDEACRPVLELLHLVRGAVGFLSDEDGCESLRAAAVWRDLKTATLPFLRCCALFYQQLSSVPAPADEDQLEEEEFDVLARFLGLSSVPSALLESDLLFGLAKKWANHPNVHIMVSGAAKTPLVTFNLRARGLVELPDDYSDLINSVSGFTCPRSPKSESRMPSMCLVCGQMPCSQFFCCEEVLADGTQVGPCTAHAQRCGAGIGIFLRVHECRVVLMACKSKGCFVPPPYVDEYGEVDVGLYRGNPLKLCPQRLRKIQRLWMNHGVQEEIAHYAENNQTLTAWHQL